MSWNVSFSWPCVAVEFFSRKRVDVDTFQTFEISHRHVKTKNKTLITSCLLPFCRGNLMCVTTSRVAFAIDLHLIGNSAQQDACLSCLLRALLYTSTQQQRESPAGSRLAQKRRISQRDVSVRDHKTRSSISSTPPFTDWSCFVDLSDVCQRLARGNHAHCVNRTPSHVTFVFHCTLMSMSHVTLAQVSCAHVIHVSSA